MPTDITGQLLPLLFAAVQLTATPGPDHRMVRRFGAARGLRMDRLAGVVLVGQGLRMAVVQ